MNIVVSAYSARVGGGVTYLENLLSRIPENIFIYYFGPPVSLSNYERIIIHKSNLLNSNPVIRVLWEIFVLPFLLIKLKAHVLFCPGGLIFTPRLGKWKSVTMFRNMAPFDTPYLKALGLSILLFKMLLLHLFILRSLSRADLVIFVSNYAKNLILERIKIKKSVTIYHGINTIFRRAVDFAPGKTFESTIGSPYILYVSRFELYKHHREVITA